MSPRQEWVAKVLAPLVFRPVGHRRILRLRWYCPGMPDPAATPSIRAVFLDIGNVVLYFSHEKMCRQLAAACGTTPDAIRRGILESGYTTPYDRGDVTSEEFVARLEEIAGRELDMAIVRRSAASIFVANPA